MPLVNPEAPCPWAQEVKLKNIHFFTEVKRSLCTGVLPLCLTGFTSAHPIAPAFAGDDSGPSQGASQPGWLTGEIDLNFDGTGAQTEDYERKYGFEGRFELEAVITQSIRAVIELELERELQKSGLLEDIDWEEVIEEAFIEIDLDRATGIPRAKVLLGKHQMAFGQLLERQIRFEEALLWDIGNQQEVIGITVELPTRLLQIVDQVSLSLFEAGEEDLRISKEVGGSIQLTKKVTNRIRAQASALMKETEDSHPAESRGSIGLLFSDQSNGFEAWSQILIVNELAGFPHAKWGLQIGGSKKIGPGTIIVDYQYLDLVAHELTVGYRLGLGNHWSIAPELRQRLDLSGIESDELVIGVRVRYQTDFDMRVPLSSSDRNKR